MDSKPYNLSNYVIHYIVIDVENENQVIWLQSGMLAVMQLSE